MAGLQNLRGKKVIIKLVGLNRAISASVISEEKEFSGLWFSGEPLSAEMGQAGLPEGISSPVFFVPLSQIQWLIAPKD
jgi:hypothetical protein